MSYLERAWHKLWYDKDGRVVIWQLPNAPLLIWLVCTVLAWLLPAGSFLSAIRLLGGAALLIWALLEIVAGANYFRRILGLSVLVGFIVSRL